MGQRISVKRNRPKPKPGQVSRSGCRAAPTSCSPAAHCEQHASYPARAERRASLSEKNSQLKARRPRIRRSLNRRLRQNRLGSKGGCSTTTGPGDQAMDGSIRLSPARNAGPLRRYRGALLLAEGWSSRGIGEAILGGRTMIRSSKRNFAAGGVARAGNGRTAVCRSSEDFAAGVK